MNIPDRTHHARKTDERHRETAKRTVEAVIAHGGTSRAARRAAKKSTRKRGRGWTK